MWQKCVYYVMSHPFPALPAVLWERPEKQILKQTSERKVLCCIDINETAVQSLKMHTFPRDQASLLGAPLSNSYAMGFNHTAEQSRLFLMVSDVGYDSVRFNSNQSDPAQPYDCNQTCITCLVLSLSGSLTYCR